MSKNNKSGCGCPWTGCGASLEITGCRFSIAPMSDNYINIILGAIEKVDTSKVWSETGELSTIYRGKRVHVVDTVKSCFVQAYKENIHMTMEATFSKGCPGDSDADCFLSKDDELANEDFIKNIKFKAKSKISFYPLGLEDYMTHIAHIVNLAIERGLYKKSAHYVTILEGDIGEIFSYFNEVLAYAEDNLSHYILQATVSVNSPTK